jgi:hypothetical protein
VANQCTLGHVVAPHKWFCNCGEPTALYLERESAMAAAAVETTADGVLEGERDPGEGQPAPGAPSDQERSRPGRARARAVRIGLALLLAIALGLARGQGYEFVREKLFERGPSHPDAWDPRVLDLVAFVENERGLTFEHPVYLDFVEPETFQASVSADATTMTDEERQEIEDLTAMFRAMGLIGSEVDLLDSMSEIQSDGTLAYYSFEDERIRVRGTELTPATRVTVVHELTHALQDQAFDLGRIQERAENDDEGQESAVLRGLAEGDAGRIEDAFRDTLGEADRRAADEAEAKDGESFEVDKYPPVLTAVFAAPYAFGEQLVDVLHTARGQRGIDDAFETPPRFDESLLDPIGYLAGETGQALGVPELSDGEEEIDHGGFGAFFLYLVLAQRLDLKQALAAADGWGGDSYIGFRSGEDVCVRLAVWGDDAEDTETIAAALDEWARPAAPGSASVERLGDEVRLQTCDALGATPTSRNPSVADLFFLPLTRASIGTDMLESDASPSQARCFATNVVATFSVDQLKADTLSPADEGRIQQLASACRDA